MRTRDEQKPLLTMAESERNESSFCGCAKSSSNEQYEAMGAPPPASGCCSGCCGSQQQLTSAQLVASFQRAVEKLQKAIQSTGRQSGGDSAFWIVAQLYAHKVRENLVLARWRGSGAFPRNARGPQYPTHNAMRRTSTRSCSIFTIDFQTSSGFMPRRFV